MKNPIAQQLKTRNTPNEKHEKKGIAKEQEKEDEEEKTAEMDLPSTLSIPCSLIATSTKLVRCYLKQWQFT